MKILFASRYVDPIDSRASRVIIPQARVLQDKFGVDLTILTWPYQDCWTGALPDQVPTLAPLEVQREGLTYSVILGPASWNEVAGGNVISEKAWEAAVGYGMNLLAAQKPDIFHLHHRCGFWWLLESAQRLGIPTVYSNYDWGMACLRTNMVNSDGGLCDGVVTPEKCAECIQNGRTRMAGRFNEALAETWVGEKILTLIDRSSVIGEKFRAFGAVSKPALWRTTTNQKRVVSIIEKLGHCVTPSEFGKRFFRQFGIAEQKVTVLPWFHDPVDVKTHRSLSDRPFTITYIGRVAPDKGVHLIFEALERLYDIPAVLLYMAGANDAGYCTRLKEKYGSSAGKHQVVWQAWSVDWSAIVALLRTTDVIVIPSTCMDNTPTTLIEAMAYRVPAIATAIPTISELLKKGVGYLFEYNSVESLSRAIKAAVSDQELIRARRTVFPKILTVHEYGAELLRIYDNI